jgi:DNA mismatch repair ATPase MutS
MKSFLLYKDRDLDFQAKLPTHTRDLIQDLELEVLFNAMAQGESLLLDVAQKTVLSSLTDLDTIIYRQKILADCMKNPELVREIFQIATQAIENEKKTYWGFYSKYPPAILGRSITVLQIFTGALKNLRTMAEENSDRFLSDGFQNFFQMLRTELDDAYFTEIQKHLKYLKFRNGVLISAQLGKGSKGSGFVLRRPKDLEENWVKRLFSQKTGGHTFFISDRDENGARALSDLKDRGINFVANALAQSADHILNYFSLLRSELAFYIGCLNLNDVLAEKGDSICFPVPLGLEEHNLSFKGLSDVCLSLTLKEKAVGNDLNANQQHLLIITGANQGGKSTFLRSIGLAQLMMQSGMFVTAESFRTNICENIFTHYRREEDITMKSGKLEEELGRMSNIIDQLKPQSLLLLNESFAATNEREGSEIAWQIIRSLVEKNIKVLFVTHLYEFANRLFQSGFSKTLFLRAERQNDGDRTYKIIEGKPLSTSHGLDLYQNVFGPQVGEVIKTVEISKDPANDPQQRSPDDRRF